MKELLYTILELEEWNREVNCSFCSNSDNKAVCQIRTRSKLTDKILENDEVCEECKEKFESNELPKCENCGRLKTKLNTDFLSGNYTCDCKKEGQEKELPVLPDNRRPNVFYERQINGLREELNTAEVEIDTHLEALEISEDWHKRQKQELLDKIAKLEEENKQLKEQNRKIVPKNLVDKIETYEKEITELKEQLAQFTSQQQTAQIEIPPKDKGIKGFFKFGGKK